MKDKVYIVIKYNMSLGQPIFRKVFFKKEMAQIYINSQDDPLLHEIRTFVEGKREDGIAKEI